jgi:hypothetical protein
LACDPVIEHGKTLFISRIDAAPLETAFTIEFS